jgi:peptidoglycan/LPS O-acetylase OafA/YrhL
LKLAPQPRLAHLDSLRGLAAIVVALSLCVEFVVPPPRGGPDMSLQNLLAYDFNMSFAGFVVLFALSGYLIPHSIAGTQALRDFVLKRALRLYPTFLVAGVLALCLLPLSPGFRPALQSLVKSFLLMRPLTASAEFNHSHWALMVILLFYTLCLAMAAVNLLHRRGTAVGLAFGLLILCAGLTFIGSMYHRHFPIALLLGLAIAEYGLIVRQRQDEERLANGFAAITILFWSALLLIVGFAWSPNWGLGEVWLGKVIAFSAGAGLFLFASLRHRPTCRLLTAVGDASYGMFFFLPLFLTAAHLMVAPVRLVPRIATAAGALLLSYVAAVITFRLVGRPATELGRRLAADSPPRASMLQPPSAA